MNENASLKARLGEEHAELEAAHKELQVTVTEKNQVIEQLQEELEAQMAHNEELEAAHEAEQQQWARERMSEQVSLVAMSPASSPDEAEAQRRTGIVLTAISRSMVEVHLAITEVAVEWSQAVTQASSKSGSDGLYASALSEARELIDEFKDLGAELHETTTELNGHVERQQKALEDREKERTRAGRGGSVASSARQGHSVPNTQSAASSQKQGSSQRLDSNQAQPEEEIVSGKLSLSFPPGTAVPLWHDFKHSLAEEMATQLGVPPQSIQVTATRVQPRQAPPATSASKPKKSILNKKPKPPVAFAAELPNGSHAAPEALLEEQIEEASALEHEAQGQQQAEDSEEGSLASLDEFHDFLDQIDENGLDAGGGTTAQSQHGTGSGSGEEDPLGAWAALSVEGLGVLEGSHGSGEWEVARRQVQGVEIEISFEIEVPQGTAGSNIVQQIARSIADRTSSLRRGAVGSHIEATADPCLLLTRRPAASVVFDDEGALPEFGKKTTEGRRVPPIQGIDKIPPKKISTKKSATVKSSVALPLAIRQSHHQSNKSRASHVTKTTGSLRDKTSFEKAGPQAWSESRGGSRSHSSLSQSQPQTLLCDSLSSAVAPKFAMTRLAPRISASSRSSSQSKRAGRASPAR